MNSRDKMQYARNYTLLRTMANFFNAEDGYSIKTLSDGKKVFVKYLGECTCKDKSKCKCNDLFDECTLAGCNKHIGFDVRPYFTQLAYSD